MAKAIVQHHVADYDHWYTVFTEHGDVRRRHGATGHTVHRAADDPNTIIVVTDFKSLQGARSFSTDPSLADAMKQAGMDGPPQVWIVNEAETIRY